MNHQPDGEIYLALARHAIDRDYLSRTRPDLFDELWADPATRIIAMHSGHVLLADAGTASLKLHAVDAVPSAQLRVYLGRTTEASDSEPVGTAVVLAVLSDNSAAQPTHDPCGYRSSRGP